MELGRHHHRRRVRSPLAVVVIKIGSRFCATSVVNNLPLDRYPFRCYIIPMSETYDNSQASDPSPRCEDAPCCGCCPSSSQEAYDPYPAEPYDGWGGCWAGDGSGMDDLADYNAMEGGDM